MSQSSEQPVIDALYRISRVVNRTDDPSEALQLIIDEIMQVLPADSAAIELIDTDGDSLEVEAARGFPKNVANTRLRIGEGITGWVALHGVVANVPDVHLDPRYIEVDPAIRSELAVPMLSEEGRVLGVVNVDSSSLDAFSEQHAKILSLLTAEANRVLNRIWLINRLRQTVDHREALIEIARGLVDHRRRETILKQICQRALAIEPCTVCAIYLLSGDGEVLTLQACSGFPDADAYTDSLLLDQSAIGTTVRRRKRVEVHDIARTEEHHFREVIEGYKLTSLLSCPILIDGEAAGVLNIYTRERHRFDNEEKRVFSTLAGLAAAGLANARLNDRLLQNEETLRSSERLTTLGLLSAEIAHEIRNPLTVIQLLFDTLTLDFAEDDPRSRDVSVISEKLSQLESIVSRVLSFGKSQQDLKAPYALNDLVEDTLLLVRLKLRQNGIELIFHSCPQSPVVTIHKGQIQQALLNLILNASQAMPGGGRITVTVVVEDVEDIPMAGVRIADNGPGIDPGMQDRIFDSFLSGRPDGTGLGLAIVKRISKSHRGSVRIIESSAEGTVMGLDLPLNGN
jgi:signal transduction histidine kinase